MGGTGALLARRAALLRRSEEQRRTARGLLGEVTAPLGATDARLIAAGRIARHPAVLAAGAALALLVGRRLGLRNIGTVASLASAGWSLRRFLGRGAGTNHGRLDETGRNDG